MEEKYKNWIKENVTGTGLGECKKTCELMIKAFPELRMVRGHYDDWDWGKRGHWWLKTVENKIVDPTSKQFPTNGIAEYIEWEEGKEEPTGMCPNCGGECYGGDSCCSETCFKSYVAYLKNPDI